MRIIITVFVILLVACTKQNPQACCTDEADCMNVGLPVGTNCDDGLLCRGNRCVDEPCSSAGDCDITAPYCVMTDEGRCSEACTADSQCPGFGQPDADKFCVAGSCAQCRAGMNDCPLDAPLCMDGRCVTCVAHADCATGVCANGTCASEDEIAYVTTTGSTVSDCTRTSPCNTVERALIVGPARAYILIDSGTYSSASQISISGVRWFIGRGASRPVFTRSTDGPIFATTGNAELKLEYLEIFGARGGTGATMLGYGVSCDSNGANKLELLDLVARMNAMSAVVARNCAVSASRSRFEDNANLAFELTDGTATIDSCIVMRNAGGGLSLDGGTFTITNNIIARNPNTGISLYTNNNGSRIDFNTIVDNGIANGMTAGMNCNTINNSIVTAANNILARNLPVQTTDQACTYPGSIIMGDITDLKFKMPDAPPFDYHIQANSIAIDMGTVSATKTDFDGEARPFGPANDVGADELH